MRKTNIVLAEQLLVLLNNNHIASRQRGNLGKLSAAESTGGVIRRP